MFIFYRYSVFVYFIVTLFAFASNSYANDPENIFNSKKYDRVSTRLLSRKSWEQGSYIVKLNPKWANKQFIFNAPGGRPLLAEANNNSKSNIVVRNYKYIGAQKITTSKGKIYSTHRDKQRGKLRKTKRKSPGLFIISEVDGPNGYGFYGMIHSPDGREYRLESSSKTGPYHLTRINSLKEPSCAGDRHLEHESDFTLDKIESSIGINSTSTVKVLVVYSTSAKNAAGGTAAIVSAIDSMITYANNSYVNSGINAQVQLVATSELSGTDEDADFATNLDKITLTNDGFWDNVHSLRNDYGADMVSMIINNGEYCGIAWVAPGSSNNAFSVVNRTCTSSFAHELGHNFGAMHDVANAGGAGPYAHGYGWRFTGNSSTQYRTVMAYAPGVRIPHFSNPEVKYDGQATGQAGNANNALVLNTTMFLAAAFKNDPVATPISTATPIPSYTPTISAPPVESATPVPTPNENNPLPPNPSSTPTVIPTHTATSGKVLILSKGNFSRTRTRVIAELLEEGIALSGERIVLTKRASGNKSVILKKGVTNKNGLISFPIRHTNQVQILMAKLESDQTVLSSKIKVPALKKLFNK